MNMSNSIKCVVVGCTPLAKKVSKILHENNCLAGVINLHPELGASKSNYTIVDFSDYKIPTYFTKDINDKDTKEWLINRASDVVTNVI